MLENLKDAIKGKNKTALAVIIFVILLLIAGYTRAEDGARIGIGSSIVNSHLKTGEIGYEWNSWEVHYALQKAGDTKRGYQDQIHIYSVSYLTRPKPLQNKYASPFIRLGVSYNDDSPMVGDTNFRLGLGIDFSEVWRLEYSHHSSAGIHNPNTGLDYITLTYKIPPLF